LLITKSFIHEVSKHLASLFFKTLYPAGIKEKKRKKKLKSLALRLGTTWERGVPLHFLGDENEKGRKQ
jgi:hypothetical protein